MKSLKRHLAVLLGATTLLAACGGGSEQVASFKASRLFAFGDEASVIRSDGTKYTVNAVDETTGALKCELNTIWIQYVSTYYGLVFPGCNPDKVAAPGGVMYAQAGAKVADVAKQIDAQLALDGFNSKDAATMMAGVNDVLDLYSQFPRQDAASLKAAAQVRGEDMAAQVNRLANAGVRVIVSTIPEMGLSPFGIKQKAANADTDRAVLLNELSRQFNVGLRLKILNDGRKIGLVQTDEQVTPAARYPEYYGFANVVDPACLATALPPTCTTKTLVTNATSTTWLWASDTLLGPAMHTTIGTYARERADRNPF